ncbi:MAG: nuclear transport factor 2 family protein [Rhodospirillaceae bacterium]|nr:nuclear transport factor 2 family protein [Rhodospirillaceae bacterium]
MMEFADLTKRFCDAACTGGAELAALFTERGAYHDGFYGEFTGRGAIADMIDNYFRRDAEDFMWQMFEPAKSDGIGYARYRFGYTSKIAGREGTRVVFTGIGRFRLDGELIAHYTEVFDTSIGMAQLGFDGERIAKRARRSAEALRGEPEMEPFLAGAAKKIGE